MHATHDLTGPAGPCLHEPVPVMQVGDCLANLPEQQAHIVLLQQHALIGLQHSQCHPEEDLRAFIQQRIPHSSCGL